MSKQEPYYRRAAKDKGSSSLLTRIVAAVIIVAVVAAGSIVFLPRLIHHCDKCDRLFFGTGYSANLLTNTISSLSGNEDKILCRSCAETNHALEILAGKSLEDFRRPLFEKKGD